jgi:CHAT domain-containing protein/tetratricopeptide (TPR) repeat protein
MKRTLAAAIVACTLSAGAAQRLVPGVTIRDSFGGKDPTTFVLAVPANTAVRVTFQRDGLSALARLRSGTQRIFYVDNSNGPTGTLELVAPIRTEDAEYELDLQPIIFDGCGTFELSVEQAPADELARMQSEAQVKLTDARTIEAAGDTESTAKALRLFDEAIELGERTGDWRTVAIALFRSSMTHNTIGHPEESLRRMERAIEVFHELGLTGAEARAIGRMGENARRIGDIEEAEQFFARALPLSKEAREYEGEYDTINNWGLLLVQTGRWDQAIAMLQDAIPFAERRASFNVLTALHHNIGYAYGEIGDYRRSLDAYERALEIKRQNSDTPRRTARTIQSIALSYIGLGEMDKAWSTLEEARKLYDISGDPQGIGSALITRARIELERNQWSAAAASASQALPFMREVRDRRNEAQAMLILGEIDVRENHIDAAVERLQRVVEISRDSIDPRTEAAALYWLGKGMQSAGRVDDAIAYAKQAVAVVESMRQGITDPELRSTYLGTLRRYFDLLIDLLMLRHEETPNAGLAAEAFRVNERSRARTLLESLARSNAEVTKGIPPDLLEREHKLRRQLGAKVAYRTQLLRGDRTRPELLDTDRVIANLREQHRNVEAEIRNVSPDYAALQFPEPIALSDMQSRLLAADSMLVEYHLGIDRSYVWAISQSVIVVRVLPNEKTIEALARTWHDLLRRNPTTVDEAGARDLRKRVADAGAKLAHAVFAPIANDVRGKRLLIVPDGALHYIPFGALPDANQRPLITSQEIVYLPSATVLATARRSEREEKNIRNIAVFADPVFQLQDPRFGNAAKAVHAATRSNDDETWERSSGGPLRRLQFSRREAQAIHAASGDQGFQALDFEASKSTLLHTDLRGYDAIHVATHGVVNAEEPELSGLVLSLYDKHGKKRDGFVRLDDIYNLELNADLVVLSACRTALGKAVYGEGIIGLTRGFMYGGARRVAATIWSVDDRATATMMAHFYEDMLRRHATPAAALRSAQLAMIGDARWSDPYFWAAFTLHGD